MKICLSLTWILSQALILTVELSSIRFPQFPFPPKICLKYDQKVSNMSELNGVWYLQIVSDDFFVPDNSCPKFHFKQSNDSIFASEIYFNQSKSLSIDLELKENRLFGLKRVIVSPALFIDVLMEYQIVYFDAKYLLIYACGNFNVYSSIELVDSFYLLKRDRQLNDFNEIYKILLLLKSYKADLNRANIVKNNDSCLN